MEYKMITNQTIVCYMDILGYSKSISEYKENKDTAIYNNFRDTFSNIMNYWKQCKNKLTNGIIGVSHTSKPINPINIKFISDAILISMSLKNLFPIFSYPTIYIEGANQDEQNILFHICNLLRFISYIYLTTVYKTGLLLRGVITIGEHNEEVYPETRNWFIFSPALVEAVELEKETKQPRIVISENFYKFVISLCEDKSLTEFKYTFIDKHTVRCLDIFDGASELLKKEYLEQIKTNCERQIKINRNETNVLEKYEYFAEYQKEESNKYQVMKDYIIKIY